ncbi:MAG TPA: hypothetical protein VEH27_11255 [Methylomirabilota bacterium]|nr:hypothetical protein [Methylomirabilota bacterium]
MTTQANIREISSTETHSSAAMAVGLAVIGCLVAGAVGILKAMSMETGAGVFCCLLGSVAAFGMVFYIYLRRE